MSGNVPTLLVTQFSIDMFQKGYSLFSVCTMQDKLPLTSVFIQQNSCPARVPQFCCNTFLSYSAHIPLLFPTDPRASPGDPLRGQDHGLGRIATESKQRCRLYTGTSKIPSSNPLLPPCLCPHPDNLQCCGESVEAEQAGTKGHGEFN